MRNRIARAGRPLVWVAALMLSLGSGAAAHEFFIEPLSYEVPSGGQLQAHLRVGENMEGGAQPYLPPNFERFDLVMQDEVQPVEGRAGDRPALNIAAPGDGLAVVAHVTRDYRLTYVKWDKFKAFLTHKDALWVLGAHQARGLNTDRVVERYSRYGKSLIAVGDGAGSDRTLGLLTEIVAGANPYTEAGLTEMPVTVLYDGAARGDAQVEVFEKAPDGTVTVAFYRTDDSGQAQVAVQPGHSYLVDAVVLRPLEAENLNDPTWESLWASLTFAVPAAP